jgi:hypothetical protein
MSNSNNVSHKSLGRSQAQLLIRRMVVAVMALGATSAWCRETHLAGEEELKSQGATQFDCAAAPGASGQNLDDKGNATAQLNKEVCGAESRQWRQPVVLAFSTGPHFRRAFRGT